MSLLYLLFFLTPFHNDPRVGMVLWRAGALVVTPVKILGVITAAGALLTSPPRAAAQHPRSAVPALFLLFVVVPTSITLIRGLPAPKDSIGESIAAVLLFVATLPLVRTKQQLVNVVRALVLGFAFGSLWLYKEHFIEHEARAWGLEGDANYQALMLLLAFPLAFWMARSEESLWWRRIGLTCSALLAGGLVLTESRGGTAAAGGVGLLAALRSRRKVLGMMLLLAAAFLIFNFGPQRFEDIKFSGTVERSQEFSPIIHVELAKAGLRMIAAHPIIGVGLGQFRAETVHYDPEILKLSRAHYLAHDNFIQIGAEAGIPALLLFLAMLGVGFRNARLAQRSFDHRLGTLGRAIEFSLIGISLTALSITVELLPFCIVILLSHRLREIAAAGGVEGSAIQNAAAPISQLPTRAA